MDLCPLIGRMCVEVQLYGPGGKIGKTWTWRANATQNSMHLACARCSVYGLRVVSTLLGIGLCKVQIVHVFHSSFHSNHIFYDRTTAMAKKIRIHDIAWRSMSKLSKVTI